MADAFNRIYMFTPNVRIVKPPETDSAARLLANFQSGVVRLKRQDQYYWKAPSCQRQRRWNVLRFSLAVTRFMPMIECLVSRRPVPFIEFIDQLTLGNLVIRLMTVLDEELKIEIKTKGLTCTRHDLNGRISAVSSLVSNPTKLHDARKLRNSIGHQYIPSEVSWDGVESVATEIELALVDLNVIGPSPKFTLGETKFIEPNEPCADDELMKKHLILGILGDGKPFAKFVWPYVWILDPEWEKNRDP